MHSYLTADVPAEQEYVSILRAVVGSASSLVDARVETIQDLRLVVDEACGRLLALGGNPGSLHMRLVLDTGRIDIEISTDGNEGDWASAPDNPLADQILSALTDGYRMEHDPDPKVVMTKSLLPETG